MSGGYGDSCLDRVLDILPDGWRAILGVHRRMAPVPKVVRTTMKRNIYTSLRISHTLEAACFTVFDRDRDVINYFYFVPIKHTRLGELEVVEYSRVRNYVFNDEQLCAHMQWADPEIVEVDLTPYLL